MMSRKNIIVFVLAIFMSSLPVFGETVYTCSFEQNEQINGGGPNVGQYAFVTGGISYQGDPCWFAGYWNAQDANGYVEETDSDTGSQCLHVWGPMSPILTLNSPTHALWFEFAFKPNFDGSNPSAVCLMKAIRGLYTDVVGYDMTLTAGTGKITINTVDLAGLHTWEIGDFVNHQWQTISFKMRTMFYLGVTYYDVLNGGMDVFLGNKYIMTVYPYNAYHSLQTICFTTAPTPNIGENSGDWFIDSIHIGDEPVLAAFPAKCGDRNTVYLDGDISGPVGEPDCYLDLYDLAALAGQWLQ
jgi:hypothetical protein